MNDRLRRVLTVLTNEFSPEAYRIQNHFLSLRSPNPLGARLQK